MTIIGLKCPRCRQPPCLALGNEQAFCDTSGCDVLAWNPSDTMENFEATAVIADLGNAAYRVVEQ